MYSSAKQEGQGPAVVPRNNQEATRAWAFDERGLARSWILPIVRPQNVQNLTAHCREHNAIIAHGICAQRATLIQTWIWAFSWSLYHSSGVKEITISTSQKLPILKPELMWLWVLYFCNSNFVKTFFCCVYQCCFMVALFCFSYFVTKTEVILTRVFWLSDVYKFEGNLL